MATVGLGSAATVARAARIAAEAQQDWVKVNPEEKRKLFIRAEQVMRGFAEEYTELALRALHTAYGLDAQ